MLVPFTHSEMQCDSVEHSQSQLEGNLIMIRKSFAQQFSHIKTAVICTSQSPEHPMTVVEFWRQEQVKVSEGRQLEELLMCC